MPYIAPELRRELDPLLDTLAEKVAELARAADSEPAFAGVLNYALTRLALKAAALRFGKLSYGLIAILTGVFTNVSQEFYRRLAGPYENHARQRSGDVDIIKEFLEKLEQP